MPLFPLFVDLTNKKCIVIGGGKVATRKILTLLPFNPQISIISPELTQILQDLNLKGLITHESRQFLNDDISDAYLVVAATNDTDLNKRIYNLSIKKNILVNVVDNPQICTFSFPAICKENDIVIGISTSGKFPLIAKKLKEKISSILEKDILMQNIEKFSYYRKLAKDKIKNIDTRKKFLEKLLLEKNLTTEKIQAILGELL